MYVSFQTAIAGFVVVVHLLHLLLDVRQLKALSRPAPPESKAITQEEYRKTQGYNLDKGCVCADPSHQFRA